MLKNINKICRGSIPVLLILAIALFARLVLFFHDVTIDNDGIAYGLAGKNLVESGKYEVYGDPLLIYPPVYPIAIGIVDHFSGNLLFSGRFVSLLFGMLLVYAFYAFGKKLYGKEAGLFASFFAATNYSLIIYSQETQAESMYLFFILLTFYFYLKITEKYKNNFAIAMGSSTAIAYLIRPEALLFLILSLVFFIQRMRGFEPKKAVLGFFLMLFSFLAVSTPYIYFLYKYTGKISLTEKASSNIIHGVIFDGIDKERLGDEEARYYERSIAYYDESTNMIKDPSEFREISLDKSILNDSDKFILKYIRSVKSEIMVLLADHSVNLILLPLLVTYIYFIRSKKDKNNIGVMSLISFLYFLILPFFHIESRYLLQVLVFLILLSSFGYAMRKDFKLSILRLELPSKIFFSYMRIMILFLVSLQFVFSIVLFSLFSRTEDYPWEYKLAGEFIKNDHLQEKDVVIMSRNRSIVSYYANTEHGGVNIPYTDALNVIKFAKANKVNYIVIDKRFLQIRENYDELADLDRYAVGIKLVYEDDSVYPVRVFKLSY
ncbi:MAG: glycosyltransferase family 39 protein [Candidatus Paceibacterota bacterium]|jgi:hypothetical protein